MSRQHILVVDDQPENLRLVRHLLESFKYSVLTALNAEEALEQVRRSPPDLILMDVQLPGISGLELTARIKADPLTRSIPVVAVTASDSKNLEANAKAAGCAAVVAKPIDGRALPKTIARLLSRDGKKKRRP